METKLNFGQIWIAWENLLVFWGAKNMDVWTGHHDFFSEYPSGFLEDFPSSS